MAADISLYLEYNEDQYAPWAAFFWHMGKVASLLEHRPGFIALKQFAVALTRPFAEQLDVWADAGSHQQKVLKTALLDFLCRMQDEGTLRKATDVFNGLNPFFWVDPNEVQNT